MTYDDGDIYFHHKKDKIDTGIIKTRAGSTFGLYGSINGHSVYKVEGVDYHLNPGSILLIRPAEVHIMQILPDVYHERIVVFLSKRLLSKIDPDGVLLSAYNNRALGKLNLYNPEEFTHNPLERIMAMCAPGLTAAQRRVTIIANSLMLLHEIQFLFTQKKRKDKTQNDPLVNAVSEYINQNLSENITMPSLSKRFFLSASQLERKFKNVMGLSVGQYLTIKRMVSAKIMLDDGVAPGEACASCGYKNYTSFYKAYKKYFGISPSMKASEPT